ncbi:MAG: hypothetical protein KJ702_12255, partial [Gammaproteobacteria bacterium]|nr:hypothetical protein [Gammaproteobacteria bacterium]
ALAKAMTAQRLLRLSGTATAVRFKSSVVDVPRKSRRWRDGASLRMHPYFNRVFAMIIDQANRPVASLRR